MSIHHVSRDILQKGLAKHNPWWQNPSYTSYPKKRGYFNSFEKLALKSSVQRAVILMGPRRVGKTVMLHQLVSEALKKKNFSAKNIFFISIDDPIYNKTSLEDLLNLFCDKISTQKRSKKLVIFDEIQYLKNWENHLKVLADKYPGVKFIASGSSAAVLKRKSDESGAGRFTDFFLPALTFSEYLDFLNKRGKRPLRELNKEFMNYINFGGYPEPILNKEIQKNVRKFIGQDIIDKVLLRDLPSLYGIQDIQELNSLLTTIAFNSGREINLEELSKNSNISKNTILKYLEYLEASFIIKRVYRIDDSARKYKRARHFKVYLTNTSMYSALFGEVSEDNSNMGNIVETAVFSQHFHSAEFLRRQLYYARWKKYNKDFEVDLVIPDTHGKPGTLLEIKWSDSHYKDLGKLAGLVNLAVKHRIKNVWASSKTQYGEKIYNNTKIIFIPNSVLCRYIGDISLAEGGINKNLLLEYQKNKT